MHVSIMVKRYSSWLSDSVCIQFINYSKFSSASIPPEIRIEFLPPYSPDLNPIEEAFSKVKAFIRCHRSILVTEGDGMIFDLMQIMEVVTENDAAGYFIHAGYF